MDAIGQDISGMTLVTGATGFLGRHVCEYWVKQGRPVRGFTRPNSGDLADGVESVEGDLSNAKSLASALIGVQNVIHLAARVHVLDDEPNAEAEFQRINVEGTRKLLDASIAAGVKRFVFASSVKAVGDGFEEVVGEDIAPRPVDAYGRSKRDAEAIVKQRARDAGLHAVILRLPLVYGPGVKANMLRLFRAVDRGRVLPLGRVANRRSLAYVGNVIWAIETVLNHAGCAGEIFFVSDGEDLSTPELVQAIGKALGRNVHLIPVPLALFRVAGRVGDFVQSFLPFPFTSEVVHRLAGSFAVDTSKIVRAAGTKPPYTVKEALRITAAWYRLQHGRTE